MNMDIFGRKTVSTRKPHNCFGCGRKFPKGTKMEASCVVECGSIRTDYLCLTCVDITSHMSWGDEFGYSELREEALEREKNHQISTEVN